MELHGITGLIVATLNKQALPLNFSLFNPNLFYVSTFQLYNFDDKFG